MLKTLWKTLKARKMLWPAGPARRKYGAFGAPPGVENHVFPCFARGHGAGPAAQRRGAARSGRRPAKGNEAGMNVLCQAFSRKPAPALSPLARPGEKQAAAPCAGRLCRYFPGKHFDFTAVRGGFRPFYAPTLRSSARLSAQRPVSDEPITTHRYCPCSV